MEVMYVNVLKPLSLPEYLIIEKVVQLLGGAGKNCHLKTLLLG